MKYILYDTKSHESFYPFSINHAMFEIRIGALAVIEKVAKEKNLRFSDMVFIVRDSIKDLVKERYPDAIVNPEKLPKTDFVESFDEQWPASYILDYLDGDYSQEMINDCAYFSMKIAGDCHESSVFVNSKEIHVSKSSTISAGAILDASNGPIIIDDAYIDIGALIKGPVYIGKKSIINPGAKLRGNVSIGPCCKIGGEIENSTFHGFSNKQHDGYLGHSYIGEWVNLGANTNNSDLKNNYSNVRVQIGEKNIDTEQMFAGCMIGDYVRTGISTMINTGTYIGIGANVFGGGFQNKYIPSFSWGVENRVDLKKFIETLDTVKGRREKLVSKSELSLINKLYNSKKTEGL